MPNHTHLFHLSARGKLRWAIASLPLFPQLVLAAGLTVVEGPGGTPQLQNQAGVPILNIVAPNAGGLSHNQFLDYNVDRQGVVLNNALQDGQSQLAGHLAANPQLRGHAASVILNEVVSRNASTLNGAQEIFGRAADYVLANPNGISVNGASFINTPNANLVVGRAELDNGKLQALNTGIADGQLTVQEQGLKNLDGSLSLIAPRIDSNGRLIARDQLNLIAGRNQVDSASARVLGTEPAGNTRDQRIDASLFGAMQAGRINIVSTAEGAGVRVGAVQIEGRDGVKISSAGSLDISGQVHANSHDTTRAGLKSRQGDVDVHSAGDLNLAATDIQGRNVKLDASRNLALSSLQSQKLEEKREKWNKGNYLFTYETHDATITDKDSREHGNKIVALQNAALSSGANTRIEASSIDAGDTLRVDSGADLHLSAATQTHERHDQGKHRKHLWNANWDKSSSEQSSVTSLLKAGKNLELSSQKTLQLQGAELKTAGDIQLTARQVEITSASRTQSSSDNTYAGDLVGGSFFGTKGDGDKGKTLNTGSKVNAGGKLIVRADQVHISGSQARGGTQASVISDKGSLVIDGVRDTTHDNRYNKDSKFFGFSSHENRKNLKDSNIVASDLRSDSNLVLQSAKDIEVSGSRVSAASGLKVDAKGDINIVSAQNTSQDANSNHTRKIDGHAGETADGSRQYRAGVRYEDRKNTASTDTTRQQASSLSGGTLTVAAGADLTVKGSDLKATQGDATLNGKNINLLATQDTHHTAAGQTTTAGGVYYTGGLDKAGSGAEISHQSKHDTSNKTTVQSSNLAAAGNLTINTGTLTTQGSRVEADAQLEVNAARVDNQAAHNSETSTLKKNSWSADAGASIEYKGISRPVEKSLKGAPQTKFHQPLLVDALEQPNLGVDVEASHARQNRTQADNTAVVSQLSGSTVQVNVAGTLKDEGTQYRATDGGLKINAGSHTATAAANDHSRSEQGLDAKAGLRVYTNTSQDLNLRGSGAGGSSDVQESTRTAVVAGYNGAQGVTIEVKGDASHQGSQFQGNQAGVDLKAGGKLALNQSNDTRSKTDTSLRGNASLTLGTTPGTNGTGANLGASAQLDHKRLDTEDSQARVATIEGKGTVRLASGADLTLQGTRIGSSSEKTGDISLNAGGKLDLQAATGSHISDGNNLGGGVSAGATKASSAESSSKTGSLSANVNIGKVAENDRSVSVGQLHSNARVTLASGAGTGDAIHLQGTQVAAGSVSLDAGKGGILQESAQSTQAHNSWGLTLGAGGTGGKTTLASASEQDTSKHGINARAKVSVDHQQGITQHDSLIKADNVVITSAGDTRLAGARIEAGKVHGKIGGDLVVESRKDQVNSTQVTVDTRLDAEKNQPGAVNKVAEATGPLKDKVQAKAEGAFENNREKIENTVNNYAGGGKLSPGPAVANAAQSLLFGDKSGNTVYTPTLNLDVSHIVKDKASQASGISSIEGVSLQVQGGTQLTGARISATGGKVDLGGSAVTATALAGSDYRADVGLNLSKSPVNLIVDAKNELSDKKDDATRKDQVFNLGPLRVGGHSDRQELQAGIETR